MSKKDSNFQKKVMSLGYRGKEMEQIDLFYEELMKDYPVEKLAVWYTMRMQMPSWEELHQRYGN